MNTTYRLVCTLCDPSTVNNPDPELRQVYLGCTGHSLHKRLGEHSRDVSNGDLKNAMSKHMEAIHGNETINEPETKISAKIVTSHNGTLVRLVDESLRLLKGVGLANSKGEWGRGGGLVRSHNARTQQRVAVLDPDPIGDTQTWRNIPGDIAEETEVA